MKVLKDMSEDELVDALAFFPNILAFDKKLGDRMSQESIKNKINLRVTEANEQKNFLEQLIERYFDLNTYATLNELDASGWAIEFYARYNLLKQIEDFNTKYKNNPVAVLSYFNEVNIFDLLRNPILSEKDSFINSKLGKYDSTINELTILDAHMISDKYLKNDVVKKIDDLLTSKNSVEEIINKLEIDVLNNCPIDDIISLGDNPIVTATINLNATNKHLKNDFMKYVERKRKELNVNPLVKRDMTSAKFESLINNKVLPYIDIKIITAYAKRNSLKYKEIADCIFPVYGKNIDFDTTEAVRKTVKPLADNMMGLKNIQSLLMYSKNKTTS